MLNKSAFLAGQSCEYRMVDVPEFGEGQQVRVKSLTAEQRQRLFARIRNQQQQPIPGGDEALCCAMGMVDEAGALMFSESDSGDIGKHHPEVVSRIADAIFEISKMTKASREAIEKNLQTTTSSNV